MNRRSFLAAAGLTGAGLAGYGLLRRLWNHLEGRNLQNYSIKSFGCFPVVAVDEARGLSPLLCLQGVSFDSDPLKLTRSYPNVAALAFYAPSGQLLWDDIVEFEALSSHRVVLPNLGSFGALHVVLATSDDSPLLPQNEVGVFLRMITPWGTDGHHSNYAPVEPRKSGPFETAHVVRAPRTGEGVLIGLFNSFPERISSTIRAWGESGRLLLEKELSWGPHETRFFNLDGKGDFGVEAMALPADGSRAVVVRPDLRGGGFLSLASWMKSHQGFAMSHGFSFAPNADTAHELAPSLEHLHALSKRRTLGALRSFSDSSVWMSADLVANGSLEGFPGSRWTTELIVPNLTEREIAVTAFLFDGEGALCEAPPAETRRLVPPRGLAVLDTSHLGSPRGSPLTSAICHPGQRSWPNTLSKIFASEAEGRFFIQHFRPSDYSVSEEIKKIQRQASGGWASDYWISSFMDGADTSWRLQIRNYSDEAVDILKAQLIGEKGVLREEDLGSLAAGRARLIDLQAWLPSDSPAAVRILSKFQPVKVSSLAVNRQSRVSVMHGTHRAVWPKNKV